MREDVRRAERNRAGRAVNGVHLFAAVEAFVGLRGRPSGERANVGDNEEDRRRGPDREDAGSVGILGISRGSAPGDLPASGPTPSGIRGDDGGKSGRRDGATVDGCRRDRTFRDSYDSSDERSTVVDSESGGKVPVSAGEKRIRAKGRGRIEKQDK